MSMHLTESFFSHETNEYTNFNFKLEIKLKKMFFFKLFSGNFISENFNDYIFILTCTKTINNENKSNKSLS